MKVDRNQAVGGVYDPTPPDYQYPLVRNAVPLRLQIAAQLMAAEISMFGIRQPPIINTSHLCLSAADALIAAHNATCEETPQ